MKAQRVTPRRMLPHLFVAMILSLLLPATVLADTFTGGFLENDDTTIVRGIPTPTEIAAFMPSRGVFTFPAPYNTQGIRITNASDCGGQDCVDMIYSYWRNMSNSSGSNTMYIFVGLDKARGGGGPTLFSYDKTSEQLTEVGPLFPASSPYSSQSGEGWYFSYSMPTKIYIPMGSQLQRYDVLTHTFETVFDTSSQYPNTIIRQANSSNDDDVHSATLQDASTYAAKGCIAYKSSTQQFFYYPTSGGFDECQIDKSGRYLVIKEKTATTCSNCDVDNVVVDLQTGSQTVLTDQNGAGGHSDLGYGWYLSSDNWASSANAWRVFDLSQPLTQGAPLGTGNMTQGGLVHQDLNWNVFEPSHISWENASATIPVNQQYACGGGANAVIAPHSNEIVCFMLDDSTPVADEQVLVVAPVMTDLNATGGNATCPGCEAYAKDPKGNIDPTGKYFFFTSNLGGNRLDAFIAKIPSDVLTGGSTSGSGSGSGSGSATPPSVTITSPASGSDVADTISVSADAMDAVGIASVQFLLDGTNLGSPVTQAPYSISWDTTTTPAGSHVLTAVATDLGGLTASSSPVTVTTQGNTTAPVISGITAGSIDSSSSTITWTTDQPGNSQVLYGTSTAYGSASTLDASLVTSHSVVLTGLAAGTTYHYQVESANASGALATSADYTFTTAASTTTTSKHSRHSKHSSQSSSSPTLAGYWKLDEGSGSTAVDASGNGYDGVLMGAPTWNTGVMNLALDLDGTDDYAAVPSNQALNAFPLSLSFWMKANNTTGLYGLVNKYYPSSMNGYQVFLNNGNLCAWYFADASDYVWDGSSCSLSTAGATDNRWHHVVFVVDATGGRLYLDGVQAASQAWTGSYGATSTTQDLMFGQYPGTATPFLAGMLDEVRLYDGALTSDQVTTLYNAVPKVQSVAWTNLANVTVNGNSLQKTSGCDGCEDAGAVSQQQLGSAGYIQFTASETNYLRVVGLAPVGSAETTASMPFAIRLQAGIAEIREYGAYMSDVPFVSGDVFKIAVASGLVNYYKNGTLIYSSTQTPAFPLEADVSISNLGGTVTNAQIYTGP